MRVPGRFGVTVAVVSVLAVLVALALVEQGGWGHPPQNSDRNTAARPAAATTLEPRSGDTQRVDQVGGAVRLTGVKTEDDYPALALAADGGVWLAYVEYQPGRPIQFDQVRKRQFDSLVAQGHGDQIRLRRFDGQSWNAPLDVTDRGIDVWRPTVSVDGAGRAVVAWAQTIGGDWEIFFRTYEPPKKEPRGTGRWSDVKRVTNRKGTDFHVVATTDANGRVWLAWQGWRKNNFDIHVARIEESGIVHADHIDNSDANEWAPDIAADRSGNVFVTWDSYRRGNYDVILQVLGERSRSITVAGSARFEARPSLACDAQGRLWIAYELGDEQWGKDYSIPVSWDRHHGEVDRGFGLYVHRTIQLKCLVDGKLFQPAGGLDQVFTDSFGGNKSLPQIVVGTDNRLRLLFRRHLQPGNRGGGEAWHSFATSYEGQRWSPVVRLPHSSNLLDNRPALAALPNGVLSVYSSDTRIRTQKREQNDLFAFVLEQSPDRSEPPVLAADQPAAAAEVPVVHPTETEDLAAIRSYRLKLGGKTFRVLRGEFHRHTEYSAHRDGDGLLEDSWRYALDAGSLDWMGNGDHDSGYGHEYHWWQIQKVTDLFHNPPGFVAVQSYERSNRFPDGHRNVIMPRRGIRPLPRGSLKGTAETGTPDSKLLYDYLKHFGGMCAAHTGATGMGTDWRDNDPEVEPVVEIFQGCRQNYQSYEHLGAPRAAPTADRYSEGYVWNALAKGYRLGFQASSDHFSTHISYAAVLVEQGSRESIIEALKQRHCYGANDNIVLIVRSGEHVVGDIFNSSDQPTLQITVQAPLAITQLHVVRDGRYVYATQPNKSDFEMKYSDTTIEPGATHYYYVRVQQSDGSLAWASPMWITYQP